MVTTTGLRLEGGAELIAALAELASLTTERTSRATVTKEMDKALQPVAEAARAAAPRSAVHGKHMADTIGVGGKLKASQRLSSDAQRAFWQGLRLTGDKATARDMLRAARRAEREALGPRAAPPIERFVGVGSGFATLVEFGTGPRRTKAGKDLGAMPPQPFLRPAWDAQGPAVMARLTGGLKIALAKKIARAKKKKKGLG